MKDSHENSSSPKTGENIQWLMEVDQFVQRYSGMTNLRRKEWRLESKTRFRMQSLDIKDPEKYLEILRDPQMGPQEIKSLVGLLRVGETGWFRHRKQLRDLVRYVLPQITESLSGSPVQLWSAGCAEGQEAYSLALSLLHLKPTPSFSVLGTDLSKRALSVATRGVWENEKETSLSQKDQREFFHRDSNGRLYAKDSLKKHCSFHFHNLMDEKYPGRFHVIFCRNVLIYMSPEARLFVLRKLSQSLVPGGVLVLGYSEIHTIPGDLVLPHRLGDSLFWKLEKQTVLASHKQKNKPHLKPLPLPKEALEEAFFANKTNGKKVSLRESRPSKESLSKNKKQKTLKLEGPFPKDKMSLLWKQLRDLLEGGFQKAIVEVDGVDFFCEEAALQFRRAAAQQNADGGEFILVATKPGVRHWALRKKLESWMRIEKTRQNG